ncbi:hypothetical protein CDD83_8799 [Cordyceps sp. RAO-2017]|nr:hypothetical protein CDD83_8799 [Cordyceps sp. RAO-2017]
MGLAILSPDEEGRKWGGKDNKTTKRRNQGASHAQAVFELIKTELPKVVAFDQSQVFFTGVSGGSILLASEFIPAFMDQFPNSGVLLNCGGLKPQFELTDSVESKRFKLLRPMDLATKSTKT